MTKSTDSEIADRIDAHLHRLCKPPGSLGDLETIARRLCLVQNSIHPNTKPRHVTIFAADHGVVTEGVSAWPSDVTAAVATLMMDKRTASGVFAKALDATYEIIDVGLLRPIAANPTPRGTKNLLHEAAMTESQFDDAWQTGIDRAQSAFAAGNRLVIGGEMGIGNTTSASCLACLIANVPIDLAVGRGAGVDDVGLQRKRDVVRQAVDRIRSRGPLDPKQIACEAGGFEIVALAGYYQRASRLGLNILLDGFIATSAALIAEAMHPGTCNSIIAGHLSCEPGHVAMLSYLGLTACLDLKLRLGEATGALAALPLVDLAAAMMNNMATIDELAIE
jgi:nicotinate-nucleotide--dimethylbenzimidazole phosphoribosyltransferase